MKKIMVLLFLMVVWTIGIYEGDCTAAVFLTVITFLVFLYVCNKEKLPSHKIDSIPVSIVIGIFLGIISSFFILALLHKFNTADFNPDKEKS